RHTCDCYGEGSSTSAVERRRRGIGPPTLHAVVTGLQRSQPRKAMALPPDGTAARTWPLQASRNEWPLLGWTSLPSLGIISWIGFDRSDSEHENAMDPKPRPNHRLGIEILRAMTPEQKLLKSIELSEFSRALLIEGLRQRFGTVKQ